MKAIIVSEVDFEHEFQYTLDKLQLTRFVDAGTIRQDSQFENSPIGKMHRAFHYEVCQLRDRLEKAR